MAGFTSCPFCELTLPLSELQRHANNHFEDVDADNKKYIIDDDEQLARDFDLAQQLAFANSSARNESIDEKKICCLIGMQIRSPFYLVKDSGGLMTLLCKCLETDSSNSSTSTGSITLLSGYVDHFQSIPSEDVGWGCGWRNIQMLSSHLLSCRQDARDVLFGGSAFVPDIPSLQRWLEIAWEKGFDSLGSHHFNNSIYGSTHWIGATECATLFRSFGLRARIIDFGPNELEHLFLSVPGTSRGSQDMRTPATGKRKAFQVYGPMDKYLLAKNSGVADGGKSKCSFNNLAGGSGHSTVSTFPRKDERCQLLLDWVWNYFSEQSLALSSYQHHVIKTEKLPLYFQHDGHSRTIVGIQLVHHKNGKVEHTLLILDPGHRTTALERSLKENVGWQKLIKRGAHTLRKQQYQLCYIDPGIASEEEIEQLKTIDSVFIEL